MKRQRMIVWALLLACSFTARAQWNQTAGPEGAIANGIVSDGNRLIALIGNQVFQRDGAAWSNVGSLAEFDGPAAQLGGVTLMRDGDRLLANTRRGVMLSSDGGRTWSATEKAGALFDLGGKASIAFKGEIFQSEDGTTWRRVAMLPEFSSIPVHFNGALYITEGYETGLRRSTDNGATWEVVNTEGVIVGPGMQLEADADVFYVAGGRNIYRSEDGINWQDISGDLPEWLVIERIIPGSELKITTNMGLLRLDGTTWKKIALAPVTAVTTTQTGTFLATRAGIFSLADDSDNALSLNRGLISGSAQMLGSIGEIVLANTANGLYRSTDRGESWMQVSDFTGYGFTRDGNVLYTISGLAYRSSDSGATWTPTGPLYGFDWDGPPQRTDVTSIAAADGAIYLGVATYLTDKGANGGWASGGIYRSTDAGATWHESNGGLPRGAGNVPAPVNSIVATSDQVVISTAAGIYRSTNQGARWVLSMAGLPVGDPYNSTGELTLAGSKIYLRTGLSYFESIDGGISWRPLSSPLPEGFRWYSSMSVVDDRIYLRGYRDDGAGGFDERLFLLNGTWIDITATQPEGVLIESIIRAGNLLYAGTRRDGVWSTRAEGAVPATVVSNQTPASRSMSIFPNPSRAETTIEYTLATPGSVRVSVLNILGEEVARFDRGAAGSGRQSTTIDTRTIPEGFYLLRATTGAEVFEGRLVIAK